MQEASANFVVDIGGGTTDVAVISMGGVVASRSLKVAGDAMTADITAYIREEHGMLIGEATSEQIKMTVGSVIRLEEELTMRIRGREIVSGLPKELAITSEEIRRAIQHSVKQILAAVRSTIEETPPELIADLLNRSITLAGGGSLIRGRDQLIARETNLPVKIIDDPLTAVVRGCGMVLEHIEQLKPVLVWSAKEAYM